MTIVSMASDTHMTGLVQYGEISVHPAEMKTIFHEDSIKDLSPKFREELKVDVFEVNRAWHVSGEAMKACILLLEDIKKNYPRNYNSVIENELDFSSAIAYDMLKAAPWVREHDIPDAFLANISARSLRIIAMEKDQRVKAALTELIIQKEGSGVAESDILKKKKELAGKTSKSNKEVKETKERAKKELATDADAKTIRAWFDKEMQSFDQKLTSMNNQITDVKKKNEGLREDNKNLREQIANLKKEVPTTEDSKKLIEMIKDSPQVVKQIVGVLTAAKEKQETVRAKTNEAAEALKIKG